MVVVPRRRLIRDFGLVLASLIPNYTIKKYRVDFVCHAKTLEDFKSYNDRRPQWENAQKIIKITERYKRAGEILSIDYTASEEDLTYQWSYIFTNRKSFVSWNREVFFGGHFKRLSIPKEYKHSIQEKFLA